tara:strand:- start:398 stop:1168 length:771 start_codon:yes stop_codon:yes gene_type:complete
MLSPEDQERMIARLRGEEEPELEVQAAELEPEADEEVVQEEEEVTSVEATEAEDYDEEEEEETGHAVPYSRFRQVNERRKNLQQEIAARDRQLEELQAQINQRAQQAAQPQQPSYEYEPDEYEEADPDSWAAKFKQLENSNQEMQIKMAHMDLQTEIAVATTEYPNVPENYIWEAIAQNGHLSALEVAEQYNHFVSEVEEAAIARYLESQKQEAEPKNVPPRPSSQQTSGMEHLADPVAPKTMDEAREAMLMYLNS